MSQKMVVVYEGTDDEYGELISFQEFLKQQVDSVPKKYRKELKIEISATEIHGEPIPKISIYYMRERTKQELQDEKNRVIARAKQRVKDAEEALKRVKEANKV